MTIQSNWFCDCDWAKLIKLKLEQLKQISEENIFFQFVLLFTPR